MGCSQDFSHHGGTAVEGIAGAHEVSAGLEGHLISALDALWLLKDAKDGSNRDETIDVTRAIQRVERHDVLASPLRVNLEAIITIEKWVSFKTFSGSQEHDHVCNLLPMYFVYRQGYLQLVFLREGSKMAHFLQKWCDRAHNYY